MRDHLLVDKAKYRYVERVDGSTDIEYTGGGKKDLKPQVIATIKDRKFKRIQLAEGKRTAMGIYGSSLSLIQSIAGYNALVEGRIGPL